MKKGTLTPHSMAKVPSPTTPAAMGPPVTVPKSSEKGQWTRPLQPMSQLKPPPKGTSASSMYLFPGSTPLTTQLPTPVTSMPASMAPVAEPTEDTPKSMEISHVMVPFPSLNSSPDANKSPTNAKEEPTARMISVCSNYRKYGEWLKTNFPEQINQKGIYVVHIVLKINTDLAIDKYSAMDPLDWKNYLGNEKMDKYISYIVNLLIIWSYTLGQTNPLPWDEYQEYRDDLIIQMMLEFQQVIDPIDYTKVNTPTPTPVVSGPPTKALKLAPAYSRHPPVCYPSENSVKSNASKSAKSITNSKTMSKKKPDEDPDDISKHSSPQKRPKRIQGGSKSHNDDEDEEMDHYDEMAQWEEEKMRPPKSFTFRAQDSDSVKAERVLRAKMAAVRPKFDSAKWDGMSTTFKSFQRAIEGHLLQVGAGYLTQPAFIEEYEENGTEYLGSSKFWNTYRISYSQATYDRQYLFGILITATRQLQHKTIIKYESSYDGILAWDELKTESKYDGSKQLKLEQLEAMSQVSYSSSGTGGMATYIDKFQAIIAELEVLAPDEYSDDRKKRLLLANVQQASGVAHLIQTCRDSTFKTFEMSAAYLRQNSILIDHANAVKPPARLMHVEDISPLEPPSNIPKTLEQVSKIFHSFAQESGLQHTFRMFQARSFRESLSIPSEIWKELEPVIQEQINKIRQKIKERRSSQTPNYHRNPPMYNNNGPKDEKMPNQYPTMKPKPTVANLVNSIADMELSDDEDTDDDELHTSVYMVKTRIPIDPPSDVLEVRAHFEYCDTSLYNNNKIYAISDGGADSCILGQNAKVISYTGRHANLVGYDPNTTRTDKVPIVTAIIKVKSSSIGQLPVLLQLHEAPINKLSPITLLSEYQIREYGLIIDSVAKKHRTGNGTRGTQRFQVNEWVHINFEDRGGLMGFEILPIEQGDEERYDIINITSPDRWRPHKFIKEEETYPYDPSDLAFDAEVSDYPATLNHLTRINADSGEDNQLNIVDMSKPLMDTQICATSTWHRVIYHDIDPRLLRPYLSYRPLEVVKKTLEVTTQMAKMVIRHPMRRHVKSRFPHMNVTMIDEPIYTDPMFSNCKSIYHGHVAAQIFYGTKSHTIFLYGIKSKGEFPKVYKDFIREHGAPSALRRDNAKEEQSETVKDINREYMVKDQLTEPYHPQQNPVESNAIRYLKGQVHLLLDITGAPDSLWYMAAQYTADINNICSDPSLPNGITPLQYLRGVTPDISAYLQFTFWQPILYLDHEAEWPSSKERSGRWIGLAQGIGDLLTFWILDDQSKHILARSVVRPYNKNLRVKWDPSLVDTALKTTAIHGGDVMPNNYNTETLPVMDDMVLDVDSPMIVNDNDSSILKPDYINLGLDTDTLETPKSTGPTTRSKGKLQLDNEVLAINETIESFTRSKKQPYKYTKYKEEYVPPDFQEEVTTLRRSERIKEQPKTTWTSSKSRKAMSVNGKTIIVPNSIQAIPYKGLVDKPLIHTKSTPLSLDFKDESLRAYHARLDLMQAIVHPEQSDHDWQVETITDWTCKTYLDTKQLMLKVTWIGGDKQWVPLDDMRLHDPYIVIKYALKNKLTDKPGWEWAQHYVKHDKILNNMVHAYKASRFLRNIKFGVEVPQSTRHALQIDKDDNNDSWKKAMNTEVNQLLDYETFRILEDDESLPLECKFIPYHCIYDVKFDGRKKCRLVAGGHMTDPTSEEVFSGVVSMETVRTCFVVAKLNDLEVCAGDVGNAFLNSKTKENVYFKAGSEFPPELRGKRLVAVKAIYGLKSSSARFHEHFSVALRKLGYRPSKADPDLWIKQVDDHYEYIARYVDDVIVFSKNPLFIINELKKTYIMKDVGKPQYYLGGDVIDLTDEWEKEGISAAFSAETYIANTLPKLAKLCGHEDFKKANTPFSEDYHPELDETPLVPPERISLYQSLLGSANWIITLGRFDIHYSINTLSRYSMAPREGHMLAMHRVFGYLRQRPKGKILIDISHPHVRKKIDTSINHDWIGFYPDAVEDIPSDKPKPKGGLCTLTCFVDADHARDKLTRRSVTGILILLNNTPISWYSKRQKTVESSTYGSELVASRIAVEMMIALRYFISMLGCQLEPSSMLLGDNMAVVLNTTIPSSALKKKHQACNYHKVRESIAAGFIKFAHIRSEENVADLLTKPLPRIIFERLTSECLFRRAQTVTGQKREEQSYT